MQAGCGRGAAIAEVLVPALLSTAVPGAATETRTLLAELTETGDEGPHA